MEVEEKREMGSTENKDSVKQMEDIIRRIVESKTSDVTRVIHNIRTWLKDETTELTDFEIEDILLQLPILLYDAMEEQEIIGMQLDMANQIYKQAQSEAYKLARGTIPEKTAVADLTTRAEQLEKVIYDKSYKAIKLKFEMAIETLNAVKKVQAARQQKNELGRFVR